MNRLITCRLSMEINHHHMLISIMMMSLLWTVNSKTRTDVRIGVILDMDTSIGKMSSTCISMAIRDFYQKQDDYTTVIRPHFRDSKQDNVQAASAAIDLLKNVQVMAILGPTKSRQADFVIDIGNRSKVPIISPATSPSLSPKDNSYFIRAAHNSTSQLDPVAAMIQHFKWKELVFVYEDDEYGRGLIPHLSDAMMNVHAKVMYHTVIHPSASDDCIRAELYKLKTMQTRVFVVHALPELASRFFKNVNATGMMEEGYVWIITEVLTSRLHSLDRMDIESMQGVLGVKSYIPRSTELIDFEKRWRREFRRQYPEDEVTELDMFGIWLYDAVFALLMALEKVGNEVNMTFQREQGSKSDLDAIGTTDMGSSLVPLIRNSRFKGLSGNFHIVDGQLQPSVYEMVNIIGKGERSIGFWSPEHGISKTLNDGPKDLKPVTWPGDSHVIPKGWEIPTSNENKLKVGVPAKGGFVQFIDANTDPQTKQVVVTGFCVDVFNAVVGALPYAIKHEFIPFVTPDGNKPAGSYNDLIYNLSAGKYDAVAGDITIRANRSDYVDFTLPYAEGGVSLIVPRVDERKSAWIFMRPYEKELWITTGAFFIYTGFVVWILEHRVNQEFQGPPGQQVGMILWFSFSTLVFAHREKLISNLSRFVVIVWVFVVLVLTSSYTASLTSMLTVEQLKASHSSISEIQRNGESVGYQEGSFVKDMLINMGFDETRLKSYSTFEQYDSALASGSQKGGVSAIMDEIPYIQVFLAKYCTKYTMTGPTYKTAGFGFVSIIPFLDFIPLLPTTFPTKNVAKLAMECNKLKMGAKMATTSKLVAKQSLILYPFRNGHYSEVSFLLWISYLILLCIQAFPKGSPLVHDISRAVLQVTEEQMLNISNQWFGAAASCDQQNGGKVNSGRLRLDSFKGLFLIAGLSSTSALLVFIFRFLHQNREILLSEDSVRQKIAAIVKTFDVFKDDEPRKSNPEEAVEEFNDNNSPAISVFHQEAGMFSHDEGFSTTEPGTPVNDTIHVVETATNIR